MTDLFDRPVDWGDVEAVAERATAPATAETHGNPPKTARATPSVASVASVADVGLDHVDTAAVATRATSVATPKNGGFPPMPTAFPDDVAGVATVAWGGGSHQSVASRATDAATAGNGGKLPNSGLLSDPVASVASVASVARATDHPLTEGQRLAAALRAPLAGHVADVATVADAGIAQRKSLHSPDFPTVSQDMAAAPATLAATVQNWTVGVRRLRQSPALKFYHGRWYQMVSDARAFLALWAEDALKAGWGTLDVFGGNLDPLHGRYDRLGLVVLLKGRAVQEIGPDSATVGNSAKDTSTYYRQRRAAGGVPVWQWCLEGSQ